MQQNGDVRGRQAEHHRYVFAGDHVQHPQRHDRTLQLPEVIEAPDHERKVLRLYQPVDRQRLGAEKGEGLIARIVWARDLVPAASIPRVVSGEDREQLDRILVMAGELILIGVSAGHPVHAPPLERREA
jgi:hypothetical protein